MLRFLTIALFSVLFLLSSPAQASEIKNYEILDTITIPADIVDLEPNYTRAKSIVSSKDHYSNFVKASKKKKAKNKSCKKFGPIELNFMVNPFNLNRTGITFDLDLLESMEILASHQSLEESFKVSDEHHIISDEVKTQLHRIGSWFNQDRSES